MAGAIDQGIFDEEYGTSANITFRPYIVNPEETLKNTSRFLARRYNHGNWHLPQSVIYFIIPKAL